MLPYSRNNTYGAADPLASADVNELQDWLVYAWDAIAGADFVCYEDFIVGLGASSLTSVAGANATAPNADHAAGGFGALSLPPAAGAHETFESMDFPLSGRRWRVAFRMRWKTLPASVNSYCFIGISDTVGPTPFYWKSVGGGGAGLTWALKTAGGDQATSVVRTTGYRHFELRSDGTTLEAAIDGTVYYTTAVPNGFKARLHLDVFRDAGDAACEMLVDAFKIWVSR